MATYRLIHQEAETGVRSSSLSDFGFCVWVSYLLAADDFGVCPATAAKLQGASPRLARKPAKAVQAEIEKLIAVRLCGVFTDGPQRYLYQADWQDRQKLKYATASSLPHIPGELLAQCSPKTRKLFADFHSKVREGFSPRVGACDAPATADADASDLLEESPRETTAVLVPPRESVASRASAFGIVQPGAWDRQHASHAFRGDFCGWLCLPESVVTGFAGRAMGAGQSEATARESVRAWALSVKARWLATGTIPGDDIFEFWRNEWKATHGSNKPATSLAFADPLAGLREAERRG